MAHVMVDICGPLPVSHNGYKYILTCLDRCSRVVAGLPLKQATASECAEAFLHGWVKLYGLPGVLTSDRGSNFSANLWQEMLKNLNIDITHSALYRPQSMGMLERTHGPIKESLKAALQDNAEFHQEKWIDHLPWVLLGKNSAFQEDLGASAYQMLYGFAPTLPGQILNPTDDQESIQQLQDLLISQQKRVSKPAIQPSAHNKPENDLPEIPPDVSHVYTKQHKALGLQPTFAGPFPVVERISKSVVKIKVGCKVNGDPIFELRHLGLLRGP